MYSAARRGSPRGMGMHRMREGFMITASTGLIASKCGIKDEILAITEQVTLAGLTHS